MAVTHDRAFSKGCLSASDKLAPALRPAGQEFWLLLHSPIDTWGCITAAPSGVKRLTHWWQ